MLDKNYIMELAKIYGIEICEGKNHMIKEGDDYRELLDNDLMEIISFDKVKKQFLAEEMNMNTTFDLACNEEVLGAA
jgi:hypothetical protein